MPQINHFTNVLSAGGVHTHTNTETQDINGGLLIINLTIKTAPHFSPNAFLTRTPSDAWLACNGWHDLAIIPLLGHDAIAQEVNGAMGTMPIE